VAAKALGLAIAARGANLVYGGASVGLMGAVADAALSAGGTVVGVIPRALMRKEVAHAALSELHVVETMHQRKALMEQCSDAFVALPGGFGTLDKLCEILAEALIEPPFPGATAYELDGVAPIGISPRSIVTSPARLPRSLRCILSS
jgi:uncharacterized protein (TIGR00730 family)